MIARAFTLAISIGFPPENAFMQQNTARRASIILGVFMAIVLIAGAILPLFGNSSTTTVNPTVTPVATSTFPPPITDFSGLNFDQYYLHTNGMFAVPQPPGWDSASPSATVSEAVINMTNGAALSVIDTRIERAVGGMTPEELDAHFTQERLGETWANFDARGWEETDRRMEGDRLVLDFLVTFQGRRFVARQISFTDGTWVFSARVLAPENATALVAHIVAQYPDRFIRFAQFDGTPIDWQSYYDHTFRHIVRFPADWLIADSAPGRLASIIGTSGESLRVYAVAGTAVADETAASAWLTSARPGATVLSVVPVTRGELSGFSVAYTFTNADGEALSAGAVVLNGEGVLHVADLVFFAHNVDLNAVDLSAADESAEATPEATGDVADAFGSIVDAAGVTDAATQANAIRYATILSTFSLLPPLNLSASSLPAPTLTLVPTIAPTPTVELTAEATVEATTEATVEAAVVPEATTEATVEAAVVPEATVEATAEATTAP